MMMTIAAMIFMISMPMPIVMFHKKQLSGKEGESF